MLTVWKSALFPHLKSKRGNGLQGGDIWNGVPGNGVRSIMYGEYDSVEEAEKALNELAEQYPNNKDVFIFIENILE